jgi:hypothetical protein
MDIGSCVAQGPAKVAAADRSKDDQALCGFALPLTAKLPAMRFAWLRENSENGEAVKQGCMHPLALIRAAYNIVFWVFLLPFFTAMEYGTAFVLFTVVILIRLGLNLYTNHVLKQPGQYEAFPFRIP